MLKRFLRGTVVKSYHEMIGKFKYFDTTVFFDKGSLVFSYFIYRGTYEKDNLEIILNNVRDSTCYFDLGANIGLMAIPILSMKKDVTVVSVEASPHTFSLLNKTKEGSNFNNWKLINKAISDKKGKVSLNVSNKSGGVYDSLADTNRTNWENKIDVDAVTLDELWEELNKPEVSFIKSDLEGADMLALYGAKKCIAQNRPYILIEWQPDNFKAFSLRNEDLLNFIKEINYTIYSLPQIVEINNLQHLSLSNVYTESYLLAPIVPN
jgi:FkbM family methyltransferase